MSAKQSSSDPLPYVQVDRAAKPSAAMLGDHLKVTYQHALGSLYAFWGLCGDALELRRIIRETPEGQRPELLLPSDDVQLRFELASGIRVAPIVLVRLGFLEQRGDLFRVRGMSRYFSAIRNRSQP